MSGRQIKPYRPGRLRLTRIDSTAAADAKDEVCILDGLFTEQAVDVFIGSIVAIPEHAEDLQIRLCNGIEERLFGFFQGRLAADDETFLPKCRVILPMAS